MASYQVNMNFYNYYRSGTSRRVEIALKFKGIPYKDIQVDLIADEHLKDEFKIINPQQLVPSLEVGKGIILSQSPAILEWLDEEFPTPALLPSNRLDKSYVRQLASIIGCDTHPLNNKRVLEYLRHGFKIEKPRIKEWASHWINDSFDAYEQLIELDKNRKDFSFGDAPSMADIYLIPQVESSKRFDVDMSKWPNIQSVYLNCKKIEAFK